MLETANFQVCSDESVESAIHLARQAEALRASFQSKWLGEESTEAWKPRCQIVLHSSRQSYTVAVGRGSERTVGSSLVNVDKGRITKRRIDLLGGRTDYSSAALPHELTHVVLRDRFASTSLPRWADEGIAILADPKAKQGRHLKDLQDALAKNSPFHAASLLTMDEYPRADRFGAFYGQSASLAEFLVSRKSPRKFVEFIERVNAEGLKSSLKECYGIDSVADLDRQWRKHLYSVQLASLQGD